MGGRALGAFAILFAALGLLAAHPPAARSNAALESDSMPAVEVFLPAVWSAWPCYVCPAASSNVYSQGSAYQYDQDNPVRPAAEHADKNLSLRGYTTNTDDAIRRELVSYSMQNPTQPPQFATMFSPPRVPALDGFYQVHHWQWAPSPEPGTRGTSITGPPVTALGFRTMPGEVLYVPDSGHSIGGGFEVLVLFADADTVALRYTREDSSAPPGYTLHIDAICTDPNLLALYRALDDPEGPRYFYPKDSYNLPTLRAGQPIGTARGAEVVVAVTDTGTFQDPRSCNDWWQIRPDYGGSCPPHE